MKRRSRFIPLAIGIALAVPAGLAAGKELWEERPLRVFQTGGSTFPATLLMQGVTRAEARAVIHVDHQGKLVDCLIVGYSHPEIARAALESLRRWEFEPAQSRGEAIGIRTELALSFEASGSVISMTAGDMIAQNVSRLATRFRSLLGTPGELDRPLVRRHVVPPRNPVRDVVVLHQPARVAIDFYVDDEGRPRMPVVRSASHEAFGVAAVEALLQWRFEPPTRGGEPVAVRVVQQFVFHGGPEA